MSTSNVTLEGINLQLIALTESVNLAWTLIAAYLVFCTFHFDRTASAKALMNSTVMIAGFTMLEAGSIRSKNVKNRVLKVRTGLSCI